MNDQDWYCYVAYPTDCRCIAAVHVDEPEHRKDVAKFTADQVRRGHLLERVRGDVFRTLPWRCPEHPNGRWHPSKKQARAVEQTTLWSGEPNAA